MKICPLINAPCIKDECEFWESQYFKTFNKGHNNQYTEQGICSLKLKFGVE